MDITKFQLKRVNPFQGLIIDADTWKDAHNYHRDQQRLHVLAFHSTGIVSGLEVAANSPADASVNISSGVAIDPEGNFIIVSQKQRYKIQTREKGTVYLVVQFREVPGEPYQPPEGGQPTRILEAYRIQERDRLPAEPYVEIGRIDFDPAQPAVKDARSASKPGINEIDLRNRESAIKAAATERIVVEKVVQEAAASAAPKESAPPKVTVTVGYMVVGDAAKNLHLEGIRNLVREFNRQGDIDFILEESINFKKSLNHFNFIYMTGNGKFELAPEQQSTLSNFLQSGGFIFGDGCSNTSGGADAKGAKEFGLSFNRFASQLSSKLGMVQRGHTLLSADYVFSETPPGCEPGMLLEGGNMVCSGSDYGCAWEGGHSDQPLSRDIIRTAFEIGANIMSYGLNSKSGKR